MKRKKSLEEWWESLSPSIQLFLTVIASIFFTFAIIMVLIGPVVLAFKLHSGWPLLLYSVPIGTYAGLATWAGNQ